MRSGLIDSLTMSLTLSTKEQYLAPRRIAKVRLTRINCKSTFTAEYSQASGARLVAYQFHFRIGDIGAYSKYTYMLHIHRRIHAYTTLATIDSNQRYLCYTVSTPYSSFSPPSSPAAPPVAAALASPLPRAVIQSSTSYDLYVVIPKFLLSVLHAISGIVGTPPIRCVSAGLYVYSFIPTDFCNHVAKVDTRGAYIDGSIFKSPFFISNGNRCSSPIDHDDSIFELTLLSERQLRVWIKDLSIDVILTLSKRHEVDMATLSSLQWTPGVPDRKGQRGKEYNAVKQRHLMSCREQSGKNRFEARDESSKLDVEDEGCRDQRKVQGLGKGRVDTLSCCAFVKLSSHQEALAAINSLHGSQTMPVSIRRADMNIEDRDAPCSRSNGCRACKHPSNDWPNRNLHNTWRSAACLLLSAALWREERPSVSVKPPNFLGLGSDQEFPVVIELSVSSVRDSTC
ncbi:hypothetical protein ALC53_08961 [Atta colombica]|uniref:Uncharacterized protein n=1 Tax=Atta colombica TaxID=520822 RepID=A0A151I220_9HYME|nr:hypothetical protein ALC53_08961 [Atta colombica]